MINVSNINGVSERRTIKGCRKFQLYHCQVDCLVENCTQFASSVVTKNSIVSSFIYVYEL